MVTSIPLQSGPSPISSSAPVEPAPDQRSELTARLFADAASADEAERKRLHDEIVLLNMGVAKSLTARYRNKSIPDDDLLQVAYVGLVKAVQGYDLAFGTDFLSYAVPTMRGEIKKHFRDRGWAVRPPRRIQELQGLISGAVPHLTQSLGRSPRPSEVAEHLDVNIEDVTEALAVDGCFTPNSLDVPVGEDQNATLGDLIGGEDSELRAAEARIALGPAVATLTDRERHILMLRFFEGWTQEQIAQDIGVTQMQVSRLLAKILAKLRGHLE